FAGVPTSPRRCASARPQFVSDDLISGASARSASRVWNACSTFCGPSFTPSCSKLARRPSSTWCRRWCGALEDVSIRGMTEPFSFRLMTTDGAARRGEFVTPHGRVQTPAFMPVGTQGTVKGLSPDDVRGTGAEIVLGNPSHLIMLP